MKLYLEVALVITATFTHMVAVSALKCSSDCAACWQDGNTSGVDTKIICPNEDCGTNCPPGYNSLHCAQYERCQ